MSPVDTGKRNLTTMEITMDNANKIKKKAAKDRRNISDTINEILEEYFEKKEFISDYSPHLGIDEIRYHKAFILDREKKRIVEVDYLCPDLYCHLDSSNDCEHTRFLWMSFDISKIENTDEPE